MDISISDKQIKQLSLSISITDVLDCIRNDYDSYLEFLNNELNDNEITEEEYKKELHLIDKLKSNSRNEVANLWQ